MTYKSSPPRTLLTVNNNAVGAHNELLPNNEYGPTRQRLGAVAKGPQDTTCPYRPHYSKLLKRAKKSIIHQRKTSYENPNKAKETPLHPPYMSYESTSIQGKGLMNTGPLAF